jgi:hypothetical protein
LKSWTTKRHGKIKEKELRYAAVILMAWILEKTGSRFYVPKLIMLCQETR